MLDWNCIQSSEEIIKIQQRYKAATAYLPFIFEGSSPGAGKFGYPKIKCQIHARSWVKYGRAAHLEKNKRPMYLCLVFFDVVFGMQHCKIDVDCDVRKIGGQPLQFYILVLAFNIYILIESEGVWKSKKNNECL